MKKLTFFILLNVISILSNAQTFQWARSIGGIGNEIGNFIISDGNSIYSIGYFQNTVDFDPNSSIFNLTASGSNFNNMYVTKFDLNGNFIWAKSFPGITSSTGARLSAAVDKSGDIYLFSSFKGTVDFDPGPGTYSLTSYGSGSDAFILKLLRNGDFSMVKTFECHTANGGVSPRSITVDNSKNIYVTTGASVYVDFDPGTGVYFGPTSQTQFTCKLDSSGNFVYATPTGAIGVCVRVNQNSELITYSCDLNTSGAQILVSKLDSIGQFIWNKTIYSTSPTNLSPSSIDQFIYLDKFDNIYLTGYFANTIDVDPSPASYILSTGSSQAFIAKYTTNGDIVWAKNLSGSGTSNASSLNIDDNGNIYISGIYEGTIDFDPGPGTYSLVSAPNIRSTYLTKLDNNGNFIWVKDLNTNTSQAGQRNYTTTDSYGNCYLTGLFLGTADFNPPYLNNLTSNGNADVYIVKYSDNTTSSSSKNFETNINVYPNPILSDINVDLGKQYTTINIKVTNSIGQEIVSKKLYNKSSFNLKIGTENPGLYFLTIEYENKIFNKKIIKQ